MMLKFSAWLASVTGLVLAVWVTAFIWWVLRPDLYVVGLEFIVAAFLAASGRLPSFEIYNDFILAHRCRREPSTPTVHGIFNLL